MKALVALALAALAGCGIDPRSDEFRCGPGIGGCDPDRTCVDGWCVADDPVDAPACPAVCSRCEGGTCIIECDTAGECDQRVICPAGLDCDVRCQLAGSCGAGVQCSTGRCSIACDGAGSCGGDLDCGDACACVTSCGGAGACGGTTTCPGPGACTVAGECTDGPGPCDRC